MTHQRVSENYIQTFVFEGKLMDIACLKFNPFFEAFLRGKPLCGIYECGTLVNSVHLSRKLFLSNQGAGHRPGSATDF